MSELIRVVSTADVKPGHGIVADWITVPGEHHHAFSIGYNLVLPAISVGLAAVESRLEAKPAVATAAARSWLLSLIISTDCGNTCARCSRPSIRPSQLRRAHRSVSGVRAATHPQHVLHVPNPRLLKYH